MAKPTSPSNGNGPSRLEEAKTLLINNQAAFVGQSAEIDREHTQFERATANRFTRIESLLGEVIRTRSELVRMLERFPEAEREKIGVKPPR